MTDVLPLLDDAERGRWPATSNDEAWTALTNWAFQTACLMADEAENVAWEEQMLDLLHQNLDAATFIEKRMAALKVRLRARKLVQANLRYQYGFRGARRVRVIHSQVRDLYRDWQRPAR